MPAPSAYSSHVHYWAQFPLGAGRVGPHFPNGCYRVQLTHPAPHTRERVCFPESPCWKVRVLTPIVQMMKLRLRDRANGRGKQVRSRRDASPSGSDSWASAVALLPSVWCRRNMLKLRDGQGAGGGSGRPVLGAKPCLVLRGSSTLSPDGSKQGKGAVRFWGTSSVS